MNDNAIDCIKADPIEVIRAQVDIVKEIERNETWYEGERRNCWVDSKDPVVQNKLLDICFEKGAELVKKAIEKVRKK